MTIVTAPADTPRDFSCHWVGVDDTTPDGYLLAAGKDGLGRLVTYLFAGIDPATAVRLGAIIDPSDPTRGVFKSAFVVGRGNAAIAWLPRSSEDAFRTIIAYATHPTDTEEPQS